MVSERPVQEHGGVGLADNAIEQTDRHPLVLDHAEDFLEGGRLRAQLRFDVCQGVVAVADGVGGHESGA